MTDELTATVDAYITAWNRMDFSALAALWNAGEDGIYYVAEEVDRPFHAFSEVLDYWQRTSATIEWVKASITDLQFKSLTTDLSVATYAMHVDASMQGYEKQGFKAVGADVRVSAILRKTGNGWKYIHYAEAPLGALPFVRRMYNANVRN
jgi:ketosteroid isomerase-like protein